MDLTVSPQNKPRRSSSFSGLSSSQQSSKPENAVNLDPSIFDLDEEAFVEPSRGDDEFSGEPTGVEEEEIADGLRRAVELRASVFCATDYARFLSSRKKQLKENAIELERQLVSLFSCEQDPD